MRNPIDVLIALAAVLILAATGVGREDEPASLPLATVEAVSCTECHRAIALEWADSLHARAWVDPIYQKAVKKKRRPSSCYGCHIPLPLHSGDLAKKPKPRSAESEPLEHGISCRSCHEGPDGEILGPFGAETEAHRSVQSPSFVGAGRDQLCASCHRTNIGPVIGVAKDFESTRQADRDRSCVGCHMSFEIRELAESDPNGPKIERKGRNHRINGPSDPEFLERAFQLSLEAEEGALRLRIANGAGHRVPGLIGRRFELTGRLLDEEGQELASQTATFDTFSYLDVTKPFEWVFKGTGAVLTVTGLHFPTEKSRPIPFLNERFEIE